MTEEMKKTLRDKGRGDLVDVYEFTQEGYAGVNKMGQIVDRRKFPEAIPMPENKLLGTPKPKPIP